MLENLEGGYDIILALSGMIGQLGLDHGNSALASESGGGAVKFNAGLIG